MPVYRNGIGSEEPHRDARFEKGDVVAQNQGDGVALADPERLQPRCGPPGALEQRLARNKTIAADDLTRSEEHTSELQSLMRISYAVFCLKKKKTHNYNKNT